MSSTITLSPARVAATATLRARVVLPAPPLAGNDGNGARHVSVPFRAGAVGGRGTDAPRFSSPRSPATGHGAEVPAGAVDLSVVGAWRAITMTAMVAARRPRTRQALAPGVARDAEAAGRAIAAASVSSGQDGRRPAGNSAAMAGGCGRRGRVSVGHARLACGRPPGPCPMTHAGPECRRRGGDSGEGGAAGATTPSFRLPSATAVFSGSGSFVL